MSLPSFLRSRPNPRESVVLSPGRGFVVERDAFGNPAVTARSLEDATVGWGYVCASDRYFQIAWNRRILRGTLASLIGDRPLGDVAPTVALRGARVTTVDVFARAMDFVGAARRSLDACSPAGRDAAARYAQGINLWIERHGPPLESRVLGEDCAPWLAEDCALLAKGVGVMLTFSWRAALASLHARGHRHALDLRSEVCPADTTPELAAAMLDALRTALGAGPASAASNAVAVSGRRSRTRGALLAADPHMPLVSPCLFYEVALRTPELRVQGATVPGTPIVSMGQTAHVAWGITAGWGDDSQLYLETPAALRAATEDRVSLPCRGGPSVEATIRRTPRGPVISDLLPGVGTSAGGVSMRWVGMEATRELDAAALMLRARDVSEARASLAHHACPTVNVVFADSRGEVGFQYAGWIPRRESPGVIPAEADDPRAVWRGFRTTSELPGCETPPSGVIVSCNTQPDGHADYTPLVEPPFRFLRWNELLATSRRIDASDLAVFQRDVKSEWAQSVAAVIAPHLEPRARRSLTEWDGHAHRGSARATLVYATLRELARDLGATEPELAATFEMLNAPLIPLTRAIATRVAAAGGGAWVRDAVARAEAQLDERFAARGDRRWGALHRAHFPHVLGASPLARLVNVPPVDLGGDGTTVAMASINLARGFDAEVGPSLRYVLDVSRPERSRGVLVPGASGHARSAHYADQLELWAEGKLRPLDGAFRP